MVLEPNPTIVFMPNIAAIFVPVDVKALKALVTIINITKTGNRKKNPVIAAFLKKVKYVLIDLRLMKNNGELKNLYWQIFHQYVTIQFPAFSKVCKQVEKNIPDQTPTILPVFFLCFTCSCT